MLVELLSGLSGNQMKYHAASNKGVKAAQLADHIRDLAAVFLLRELSGAPLVTITQVNLTPDLQQATIWFRVFPVEQLAKTTTRLNRLAPKLQHEISQKMQRRFVPKLRFQADQSVESSQTLDNLLNQDNF